MKFFKRVPVFKVKILYKSGNSVELEFLTFTVSPGMEKIEWTVAKQRPIVIGLDNIEAIFQMGHRHVWKWQ